MTSEIVKIPTLESVTAEGYAKLTVYIDFDFREVDGLSEYLPYEGEENETQEDFAERIKGMIESAVEREIEGMFDRMGYQSGEPDVVEVCIDEVTITESGVETDEEEIEEELEDV